MLVEKATVGNLRENCYILSLDNKVLVIDPGDEYEKINEVINNREILGVLITHNHEDHVGALPYFSENKIYRFDNLKEGNVTIGPFTFEVIFTPGHTDDCVTYYFVDDNVMFTGDFLFKETIGRTDLPKGNIEDMIESLNKIVKYPNAVIYPGHGKSTTLDYEKENNEFILYYTKGSD